MDFDRADQEPEITISEKERNVSDPPTLISGFRRTIPYQQALKKFYENKNPGPEEYPGEYMDVFEMMKDNPSSMTNLHVEQMFEDYAKKNNFLYDPLMYRTPEEIQQGNRQPITFETVLKNYAQAIQTSLMHVNTGMVFHNQEIIAQNDRNRRRAHNNAASLLEKIGVVPNITLGRVFVNLIERQLRQSLT